MFVYVCADTPSVGVLAHACGERQGKPAESRDRTGSLVDLESADQVRLVAEPRDCPISTSPGLGL